MTTAGTLYASDESIKIGVSACLLGAEVRFDGGHKRNDFLVDTLGRFVVFVPICPEVEIGLGVPRETLRLVHDSDASGVPRLFGNHTGIDYTNSMNSYAQRRVSALEGLSGYVLKANSPSCGVQRVPVYGTGTAIRDGAGLFASALMQRYPSLPVEEEERLSDRRLRENFVERIFTYRRLRSFFSSRWSIGALAQFHTAHKLTLMAHSPQAYQEMGRLVASAKRQPRNEVEQRYQSAFMEASKELATTARHSNLLHHMLGYLRPHLDDGSRHELVRLIDDYQRGRVPLGVPLTRFRQYAHKFDIHYLCGQVYLNADPRELMLRNHI